VGLLPVPMTAMAALNKSGAQLTFDKPFSQKNFFLQPLNVEYP
jgi:hypothetical protein